MKNNSDYAKMFRSRPARFVLPLHPSLEKNKSINLIKLDKTEAQAYVLQNGDIFVNPEKICNIGCETPRINYENYLGK